MSQDQDSSNKEDSWLADLYNDKDNSNAILPEKKLSECGGPKGKEPTRYGDWEKAGRCIDF